MRILIIDRLSKACQSRKAELNTWYQTSVVREAANACEALHLLKRFQPDARTHPIQARLAVAFRKRWKWYGQELLHCYDIPGLPPDNLQLEALFGRLRRHQRRISGRQSTRELRSLGQAQVLFQAESQQDLLNQIQHVPLADYYALRRLLMESETPSQFLHRLHQDPLKTMISLVDKHQARRLFLQQCRPLAIQPFLY